MKTKHLTIDEYNENQEPGEQAICLRLYEVIGENIKTTESKLWHEAPVWFIEGNPIVGYVVLKNCVRLLFWSGQSFDEVSLSANGSFMAAEARYTNVDQINKDDLVRWLDKAEKIQWDYKNIVKRKGKLLRLK